MRREELLCTEKNASHSDLPVSTRIIRQTVNIFIMVSRVFVAVYLNNTIMGARLSERTTHAGRHSVVRNMNYSFPACRKRVHACIREFNFRSWSTLQVVGARERVNFVLF